MLDQFRHISLRQLAGVNNVLGIDLSENYVRVVELEENYLSFRCTQSRYNIRHYFTLEFSPDSEWSKKAELLKPRLTELGIKTRYAATSVRSLGIKVIEATIPIGTRSIDEWIAENQEKLLRIPLSSGHINYVVEELERTEAGTRIEITFVRKEEIECLRSFVHDAGLELITLSAGVRDASNVMALERSFQENEINFVFLDNATNIVTKFAQGIRKHSYRTDIPIKQLKAGEALVFVSGQNAFKMTSAGMTVIQPLGLAPEYCQAVGLSLKALKSDLSPTNLLPPEETNRIESQVYKSLFQRVVLFLGAAIIVLLFIPFILGVYLNWQSNRLDDQLLANGNLYTELKLLETQTQELEKQLKGSSATERSSNVAKVMHNVAGTSPEGLCLYKFKLGTFGKEGSKLFLSGYTLNSEKITDYLKSLSGLGYETNLIRSGNPQQNETLIPLRKDAITFEIVTSVKK